MPGQLPAPVKTKLLWFVLMGLLLILLKVWEGYPALIERWYTETLYPAICYLLRPVFNLFPFSMGDLLYISLVCYLLYSFFRLVKHLLKGLWKTCINSLLNFILGLQAAIIIFYLFWGLNYYRPGAGALLGLGKKEFTTPALTTVTGILIDSANALRAVLPQSSFQSSNNGIYPVATAAIANMANTAAIFKVYRPCVKPSVLTPLLNYLSTSGYYNPFTGEAQMNSRIPVFNRPFTACHEMAHQMGFATEDEANFVGFEAAIRSPDKLLRYSAYQLATGEFMHALYTRDSLENKALRKRISAAVKSDFKEEQEYWQLYDSRLTWLSSIFFSSFLKANNQPHGIETYNDMVILVMSVYDKNRSFLLN